MSAAQQHISHSDWDIQWPGLSGSTLFVPQYLGQNLFKHVPGFRLASKPITNSQSHHHFWGWVFQWFGFSEIFEPLRKLYPLPECWPLFQITKAHHPQSHWSIQIWITLELHKPLLAETGGTCWKHFVAHSQENVSRTPMFGRNDMGQPCMQRSSLSFSVQVHVQSILWCFVWNE